MFIIDIVYERKMIQMISKNEKNDPKIIKLPLILDLNTLNLDKNIIIETMDNIIDESLKSLSDLYKQGFIDLKDSMEIIKVKDITSRFFDNFTYEIILNKSIDAILRDLYESSINENKEVKDISFFLSKIIDIFKVKIQFLASNSDLNYKSLYSETFNIYHAIFLPNSIENIYVSQKLTSSIEVVLRYKKVNIFYVKSFEDINLSRIKIKENGLKISSNLVKNVEKKTCLNFKFGLEINDFQMIEKYKKLKPNFVIINPEIAYLTTFGLAIKESRIKFYKLLYEAYPDAEIILNLPRLDVLYNFHQLNLDFILDEQNFIKHYLMYNIEIEAFASIFNEKCKISIPSLNDDLQFRVLKEQIKYWFKLNKTKINAIGMSIETDSAYDYMEYYKKFDFSIIELDRLYEEINMFDDKKEFFSDVSYINQKLKIRKKEVYLIGKDLRDPLILEKLVKRGFKNFTIIGELYENFCEIVTNYNNSRGKYKKSR